MTTIQIDLDTEVIKTLLLCKQILLAHYGDRIESLILFGSAARQQLTSESDLDLLVVLKAPFDYLQELYTLVDLLYPLQLESSHWISVKPANATEFTSGATQLYRNIQQEGKVL